MVESEEQGDDRSDTGRAEAFSDAVLAIVMTLLVLDLQPPVHEPGGFLVGLLRQWPLYLATVTTFLYVVAVVWLNHKSALRRIRLMDRGLQRANLGILFTAALLPLPSAITAKAVQEGNGADERTALGLSGVVGVVLCLDWSVFFYHLSRHPELAEEDVDGAFFPKERTPALVGFGLYAVGGPVGYLVAPPLAHGIFLALPIFYGVTSEGLYNLPAAIRRG